MMHFRHDAEVVHHTCNRTRLRIPGRRRDSHYLDEACRRISGLPGVKSAIANRHSASIVIRHTEEFQMERVTEALHAAALAVGPPNDDDVAELGGEYFPQRTTSVSGRGGRLAAMVLQLAAAVLFGTALMHVLELLAKNLIQAALREVAEEVKSGLAVA